MMDVSQFHFLRPGWLLLLIPAAWLFWTMLRQQDPRGAWRDVIADHLLDHLLVQPEEGTGRLRPVLLLGLAWLVAIVALAGPTWRMEPAPFTEDEAALVIALKVTPTMLARDVRPSRLQRAVHKIGDLLEERAGARTALVAYSGSAHLVMPLTSDAEVIRTFAAELSPDLMPEEGDETSAAVALANRILDKSGSPGSIVLLADDVNPVQHAALENAQNNGGADVHLLAMAAGAEVVPLPGGEPAPPLDEDNMRAAAKASGGTLTLVTADATDVQRLAANIESSIASAPPQEGQRWHEAGYGLLPLLLLLMLFFFRPGGGVVLD